MEFQGHKRDALMAFRRISLLTTLLFAVAIPSPAPADVASFSTVVPSCFPSWVRDGSDCLTPSRVHQLVLDPNVKGDEAAAVAAIHIYFRSHKGATCLMKADLLRADMLEDQPKRSEDLPRTRGFKNRFRKFSQHIKRVPRFVFADNAPRLEGIHQGPLGDCWVVSCVGAAVHFNPLRLKEMIVSQPDGSCAVQFRNGSQVRVQSLTDGQIALSSTSGDQGLWLNVLEQAFGQVRQEFSAKYRDELGLDSISRGGNPRRIITLLTGHAARHVHIRRKGAKGFPPDLGRRPQLVAQVRDIIREAVTHGRILCAGTTVRGEIPPGIRRSHDYAIIGYEAQTDTVTLWDPHGANFEPKGPPGLQNGYSMVKGILRMPSRDFTLIFGGLFVELPGV